MRPIKPLALLALLALPLVVFVPAAVALDLETDFQPPPGEVGTPYEWEFEAEEGCVPYRFSYLNGTVPPGMRITVDGKLTGTPTEAGTFSFWVGLDDNSGPHNPACLIPSIQSQGEYTMVVLPDLAVTTKSLPNGIPGRPYAEQLQFSNPEAGWTVTWSIAGGTLPAGLTLSPSGLISGTPTGVDRKTFTVRAAEPFRRWGEQELTLTVGSSVQASASFGPGEVGLRYAAKVSAGGGVQPYTYALASGTLPRGLALDAKTGAVRGTPAESGVVAVTFGVTDAAGQRASVPVRFRIADRLAVATTRLPVARIGGSYGALLRARGGLGPRTWRVSSGALPRGIRLDARTGTLLGIPRAAGVYRFGVEARDRLGARSTKQLTLRVLG